MSTKPNTNQITYDTGSNKQDLNNILDTVVPIADYTALRAYTGRATSVRITSNGIAGFFYRDDADTSSTDNGGAVIVNPTTSKRWKRLFTGAADLSWFGAKGNWNGVTGDDDTVAIQAALDSGIAKIEAAPGLRYKTTNTLFLTANNTTVDFNGSIIDNKSNSRYAICLVTADIGVRNETNLTNVMATLHYGNEVTNSHIRNLNVEMSNKDTGGANLGVGIVYGKNCTIDNINVKQTNGNGLEVRNSTLCRVSNAYLTPRTYGALFFQTKDCSISDSFVSGCSRGIITKQSQGGAPVNFRAMRCIVEDLTDSLYYAVGGDWKERTLTDPIYLPGHEFVTDVLYEDCTFRSSTSQAKVDAAYFASRFTFKGCLFSSVTGAAGGAFGTNGNPVLGDPQGRNHKLINCTFQNGSTVGNTCLGIGTDMSVSNCVFSGSYQRLLIAINTYAPLINFSNNVIQANLQSADTAENSLLYKETASTLNITNNTFRLTVISSGNINETTSTVAYSPTLFFNNVIRINGTGSLSHTTLYINNGLCHSNDFYYENFGSTVYSMYVIGAANIQNNSIGNNGNVGVSSRALYMVSASVEVPKNESNYVYGTWEYTQYANLSQNYQYNKRVKAASIAPTSGTWGVGDRVYNVVPSVGQPKSWVCTVAGTPGTWVSEGNL